VRSSFETDPGTWVVPEEEVMEELVVSGVADNLDEARIGVGGVEGVGGGAARLGGALAVASGVVERVGG
jgi:aspartate kinase